ncbi:MAG: DUF2169 domain-containing protein [Pseudomonadota bacterium]
MWALINKTPFSAGKAFERDRVGHEVLCLAVRATLKARDDGFWMPCDEQIPISLAPQLGDEEMIADADIIPFLPGAEVLVRGTVRGPLPPEGQSARISVGDIEHHIRLWPARQARLVRRRVLVEDIASSDFGLTWSNAAGGVLPNGKLHPANPVGTGLTFPENEEPVALPRILAPDDRPEALKPTTHPVSVGPIHRHWSPRLEAAGTYDSEWQETQAPCLPKDFDPSFYFSAPPPLRQSQPFQGNELLEVSGFGTSPAINMRLPSVVLTSITEIGIERVERRPALHRITIDIDTETVDLLWLASIPCDGRDHLIRRSTLRLKQVSRIAL